MEELVQSDLFRNALIGGTIAAILCSTVGFFMVVRALTFASEALTDIGFAGATGAALFGFNPFLGMLGLGLVAALFVGGLGSRAKGRDIEIGMTLSFALGLGVLFFSLASKNSGSRAGAGLGLLFGSLMSVTDTEIVVSSMVGLLVVVALVFVFRPLLFASVDPSAAKAKGVPTGFLGVLFLVLLAATVAVCVQVMGILLCFSLLAGPAGAAQKLTRNPTKALVLAVVFGIFVVWAGLLLTFFGPFPRAPLGFYVATLASALYGFALVRASLRRHVPEPVYHHHHHDRETH